MTTLADHGGRARAADVLRSVREAATPYVPVEWQRPHPPYHSRLDLYTALERATLRDAGLIDASERGYWKLTPAGREQARKLSAALKSGTSQPNKALENLAWNGETNWLGRVAGSLRDEPDFHEVLRLGRDARRANHRSR